MYTLLVFTYFMSGGVDGGSFSSVTSLEFANKALCEAAAEKLNNPPSSLTSNGIFNFGLTKHEAVCLQVTEAKQKQ